MWGSQHNAAPSAPRARSLSCGGHTVYREAEQGAGGIVRGQEVLVVIPGESTG